MSNDNDIKNLVDKEYNYIKSNDGAFGRWIVGLWGWFPNLTYQDQKEAFFYLIKRLLDEGLVYFEEPADADFGEKVVYNVNVWAAPHDEIIQYFRDHWPADVVDARDEKLNGFWYDIYCPRILWFDKEENVLIGS